MLVIERGGRHGARPEVNGHVGLLGNRRNKRPELLPADNLSIAQPK